ncbi:hypothetical protein AAMO2058_001317100 [Amorphochlora amoebiformis]
MGRHNINIDFDLLGFRERKALNWVDPMKCMKFMMKWDIKNIHSPIPTMTAAPGQDDVPRAPSQPAPMLASRYSSASLGGYLLRDSLRLRHVKGIFIRNLQGEGITRPVDCYFELVNGTQKIFTSPIHPRTFNPDWVVGEKLKEIVEEKSISDVQDIRMTIFVRRENEGWKTHIERKFRLSQLEFVQPIKNGLASIGDCSSNAIIFILSDGIYAFPKDVKIQPSPVPMIKPTLKITVSAILQQHSDLQEMIELLVKGEKIRKEKELELGNLLKKKDKTMSKSRRIRASLAVLKKVKDEMDREENALELKLKLVDENRKELKRRAKMVLNFWQQLQKKREALLKLGSVEGSLQRERMTTRTRLHLRQFRMLYFLYGIYPVRRRALERKRYRYTIRDATVADRITESVAREISIALGYCAHLMQLVSKYTGQTLRYKIDHKGSKSWVSDECYSPPRCIPLFFKDSNSKSAIHTGIAMMLINADLLLSQSSIKKSSEPSGGVGSLLLHKLWELQNQLIPLS